MQLTLFNDKAPLKKKRKPRSTFDRKHYKEIKDFMLQILNNRPWCCDVKCPVEWAMTFFPLIPECVQREDYEGAQATKDAIIEFLNGFGAEIPKDAMLNLPEYEPKTIRGIVCFGKEDDPSGLASGGAIIL